MYTRVPMKVFLFPYMCAYRIGVKCILFFRFNPSFPPPSPEEIYETAPVNHSAEILYN